MPKYMLLIYTPTEGVSEAEMPPRERWFEYTQQLQDAGVYVGGDPLLGVDTATTVRVRDGETQITDGPFADTKEYLAGYYLIDAPDLDTALKHSAHVPNVHFASIEVRPLMDFPTPEQHARAEAQAHA
jgi:hypothetical protein